MGMRLNISFPFFIEFLNLVRSTRHRSVIFVAVKILSEKFDGLVDAFNEMGVHGAFGRQLGAGGDDGVGEAEALGFGDALLDLVDGAEFAEEAELAEDDGAPSEGHWAVHVGTGDSESDGGVGRGVGKFNPPHHVDEDIFVDEAETSPFFEDGDDHRDA